MKDRWGEFIFRNHLKIKDVTINTEPDGNIKKIKLVLNYLYI